MKLPTLGESENPIKTKVPWFCQQTGISSHSPWFDADLPNAGSWMRTWEEQRCSALIVGGGGLGL
jgi:hypothetical protein